MSFDRYKTLTAWPATHEQASAIQAIDQWREVDLFSHRIAPGKKVDLMVPPSSLPAVLKVLKLKGIHFDITNHDVQE